MDHHAFPDPTSAQRALLQGHHPRAKRLGDAAAPVATVACDRALRALLLVDDLDGVDQRREVPEGVQGVPGASRNVQAVRYVV